MPFLGVLPDRRELFHPEPATATGVNDAEAWRLNPIHRHVYDKLALALGQGVVAAPAGVPPGALGVGPKTRLMVRPIVNLAGMARRARTCRAAALDTGDAIGPGEFWTPHLEGPHISSDCLVRNGEVVWFGHTRASREKDRHRPLYWEVGAAAPDAERVLRHWIAEHLRGYTGLCNAELIGGTIIEFHLRGSNGFFDFYGPDFITAWATLVDGGPWRAPGPIGPGWVFSLFAPRDTGPVPPPPPHPRAKVQWQRQDRTAPAGERLAIVRSRDFEAAQNTLQALADAARL